MFDAEFMKKLEYLAIVSKRLFDGRAFGRHRSLRGGSGIEFSDHRDYVFGDDLNRVDWNVFARLGSLSVKRFQEDDDLTVTFFLDCSRSMDTGLSNKFDYARRVIAALAYLVLCGMDRVEVVAYGGKCENRLWPVRGRQQITRVLDFLQGCHPDARQSDLSGAVNEFVADTRRPGLVVVVSDFYEHARLERTVDRLCFNRDEPVLIQIHDESEKNPLLWGDLELVDCEQGQSRRVTIDAAALAQYKKRFQDFLDHIRTYAVEHGLGCVITSSAIAFDELILDILRRTWLVRSIRG